MTDEHLYEGQSRLFRLRIWALGQMMYGAWIAFAVVVGVGAILGLIWVVGEVLPDASKEAPSPYSAVDVILTDATV